MLRAYRIDLKSPLPDLRQLHLRHAGLTPDLCRAFAEAAEVCLSRHHEPPVEFKLACDSSVHRRELAWQPPDERCKRAWANRNDATRDGAYSISLAAVEAEYGLVAVERADTGTGADYYVAAPGNHEDLEDAYRLEVSGIDRASEATIRSRIGKKSLQVQHGRLDGPALVSVVGFGTKRIATVKVEGS
jgi:hypothetical protein